ncbi:solute carrier family 15 member 2-like isoform X2 [Notamacropus eugenii]|uniref:solute carrier family 15 member 2-like isoform X2 n=1 Tax=Notamacropus eugenii TaxID=9315 RepID=UPI003B6772D3
MEVSEVEKEEEDRLLNIKKIGNKCPASVIVLLIVKWLDSITFSGTHGFLVLYFLSKFIYFNNNEIYLHQVFTGLVIILTFVGATITDSWLGKFKFSMVLAIFFLALATGIKTPSIFCLAGDQFPEYQVMERNKIFCFLYLSTVFEKFFANILIPLMMGNSCAYKNCYLIYFSTSAGILTFNLGTFIYFRKLFFREHPKGSKLLKILKCILTAIKNHLRHYSWKTPRRDHWLDWASEKFSENHLNEVKVFFRMLLFLLPFPFLWALAEKQTSEWILQSKKMNYSVNGYPVDNEDIQLFFNTALLISLIVVEVVLIPLAEGLQIHFSLIKKMIIGMSFIYFSSLMTFLLELHIENSPRMMPGSRESFVHILNVADTSFQVNFINGHFFYSKMAEAFEEVRNYERIYLDADQQYFHVYINTETFFKGKKILLEEKMTYIVILSGRRPVYSITMVKETTTKPDKGVANVRIMNLLDKDVYIVMSADTYNLTKYKGISSELTIRINRNINLLCVIEKKEHVLELGLLQFGSSYIVLLLKDTPVLTTWKTKKLEIKPLSIEWQLPQFLIMEIGKYLVIFSGMEFFYYEAPKGMKVTMQALWTSTLSSSSLILYSVNYTTSLPKWLEYFLLSTILLALIISCFIIGYCYQEPVLNF